MFSQLNDTVISMCSNLLLCALQGKITTAAGMSAGIDMALRLAALISDDITARVMQLMMEYDSQPPFHNGSVNHSPPEIISRARLCLDKLNVN